MSDQPTSTLEARIADLEHEVARLRGERDMLQLVLDSLPQTVFWKDTNLVYQGCALRFAQFAGFASPAEIVGKTDYDMAWKREEADAFRADDREVLASGRAKIGIVEPQLRADGTQTWVETSKVPLRDAAGELIGVLGTYEDVTARRLQIEEEARRREELIAAQAAVLAELSTPLIPLADGVIAMPIVGAIDSSRAQRIMETLLEGISTQQAETAILDITGVRVVDTQVADALLRAAQAARLLGARVILTGISAEVAQALVHLGADLTGIRTYSNLQHAVAEALAQREAEE